MTINLKKGEKIAIGQKQILVGLGWRPNEGTGHAFDLDASVFMLNASKQIPTEQNFVFYNNLVSPDGAVKHSKDDTTGSSSNGGDDEVVDIDTDKLDPSIQEMLFVVTINDAVARGQNFGQVKDSYIRIVDKATNTEIARFDLNEDYSIETAVELGRLYKKDGAWKFDASGIGYREDLGFFLSKYFTGEIVK